MTKHDICLSARPKTWRHSTWFERFHSARTLLKLYGLLPEAQNLKIISKLAKTSKEQEGMTFQVKAETPGFRRRFVEALTIICQGNIPPDDYVDRWLAGDESHIDQVGFETGNPKALTLQDWAASHAPADWMMGMTIIEAAEGLASEPVDGWEDEDAKEQGS